MWTQGAFKEHKQGTSDSNPKKESLHYYFELANDSLK